MLHFFHRLKQPQGPDGVNTHFVLPARQTVHKSLSKMPTLHRFTTKAHPSSESRTLLPRTLKSRALMLTQLASQQTQEAGALWCDSSRATANTGHFLCICAHIHTHTEDRSCKNSNAVRQHFPLMIKSTSVDQFMEWVRQLKADWRCGTSDQSPAQTVAAETITQTLLVIKHQKIYKEFDQKKRFEYIWLCCW